MNHLALFNGIGGFQLAAQWVGWNNVAYVEIDEFCNKIVRNHFPESIEFHDIKEFTYEKLKKKTGKTIDIISGGFPCQPFSVAGKQRGKDDDRNLWSEMFRVIREIHPTWVVGENVANIINFVEFEDALTDLESEGYEVQAFIIPAVAVGAWHRRDRVWIIANTSNIRCDNWRYNRKKRLIQKNKKWLVEKNKSEWCGWKYRFSEISKTVVDTNRKGLEGREETLRQKERREGYTENDREGVGSAGRDEERSPKPRLGRVADGLSYWMDEPDIPRVTEERKYRINRLKALGNAIVPQVAYEIFKAIDIIERAKTED